MKTEEQLNPLINPVISGDYVKCGQHIYKADTNMHGLWNVTRNGDLVVQDIPSQVDLCAWFAMMNAGPQ